MSDEQTAIPEELSEAFSENETAERIFAALLTRDALVGFRWFGVSFRWYCGVGGLVVGH